MQPSSSSVHVNVPLGDDKEKAKKDFDPNPPLNNLGAEEDIDEHEPPADPVADQMIDDAYSDDDSSKDDSSDDVKEKSKSLFGKAKELLKKAFGKKPRRVSTVAVTHGDHLLMGKRRDNGKWTVPGGHVDPHEDHHEGGVRELSEETGIDIDPDDMSELSDVDKGVDAKGDPLHVQAFHVDMSDDDRPPTTMKDDPDGEVRRWQWVNTAGGLPSHIADNLHVPADRNILLKALGLVGKEASEDPLSDLLDMQDLIAGVDWEMECNGETDVDDAKEIAAENLEEDPNYYNEKWVNSAYQEDDDSIEDTKDHFIGDGLNLDIGSGHARQPGHIGIDLYPYDKATLIHDAAMKLPFPDGSAKSVRLVNSLHHMDELADDPASLLEEIKRVLGPGGILYYEGPNALDVPDGMEETHRVEAVQKSEDNSSVWTKQRIGKIPDPATADDAYPGINIDEYQTLPSDQMLAAEQLGYYWSDASSSRSGNAAAGYSSQGVVKSKEERQKKIQKALIQKFVPICKADKARQIVYCVVLAPEENDLQDDFMMADDIEQAAHGYLEKSRVVGAMHKKQIDGVVVESYIAPVDFDFQSDAFGPQNVKKGSWVVGLKINDPKEWAKVEDGEYTGVSVGGMGLRDEMT
jgi:8-oxo-dGTP pyrophosphatase MutT (NUDIX family)/SAM-dependent methyltransferase